MIQGVPATAPPAATPQLPVAVVDGQPVATPQAVYEAFRAQESVIRRQLSNLLSERRTVASRLEEASEGANRTGLERQLNELDTRISDVRKQLATAETNTANAAGVPGAVVVPPPPPQTGPSEGEVVLGLMFMLVVLLPIVIAFSRRIWRRGAAVGVPKDVTERLSRIEEGVDTMALEVERIGEGQRFVTNLMIEGGPPRALGMGGMEPIELRDRERVERRTPG